MQKVQWIQGVVADGAGDRLHAFTASAAVCSLLAVTARMASGLSWFGCVVRECAVCCA
jgi:hypothetical protein